MDAGRVRQLFLRQIPGRARGADFLAKEAQVWITHEWTLAR